MAAFLQLHARQEALMGAPDGGTEVCHMLLLSASLSHWPFYRVSSPTSRTVLDARAPDASGMLM